MKLSALILTGALTALASAKADRHTLPRQAAPVFPTHPGIAPFCNAWWDNDGFISCTDVLTIFGVSIDDFIRWNPTITPQCSNWQANYSYCISVSQEGSTTAKPTTMSKPTTTSVQPATTTSPGNGITTPTPIQDGMTRSCNKFHLVKTTTTCQSIMDYFTLSWSDLLKWNPSIGTNCQSLWSGTYACVGVIGGTAPPTTTAAGNGIPTPTPIQQGMTKNCNKFHMVKTTTTCQSLMDYFSLSWADLLKWNPAIGANCESLWSGTYACVGVAGGGGSALTTTAAGNGIATPTPIQQGMTKNCSKFHLVKTTTTCASILNYFGITWDNFYKWNPAVGKDCEILWSGTYACVDVMGGSPPPTSTAGNGVATPTPIQQGMTKDFNKFHLVKTTTTCDSILTYFGITWANFFKWNPAVGSDCRSLWANTYACVGVK